MTPPTIRTEEEWSFIASNKAKPITKDSITRTDEANIRMVKS
jgi:hypothetical protein